ncbi:MAG TPA: tetratricopeptide repeat protein [Gemmatimonadaceae bacterium]
MRRTTPPAKPNAEPVRAAPAATPPAAQPVPIQEAPAPAPPAPVEAPPAPWQATPRQLVRDSAYIMTNAGRLQAAIAVLDGWVREHPTDTDVALDLARLRARAGDWPGAIAQYSALIEQKRTAQLLFERGQTYLWSGDVGRGEDDLLASESLAPSAATQRQLGDHYRWQGDFSRAGYWYRLAAQTAPGDTSLAHSMVLLDRALDARLLMPGELSGGDLGSGVQVISDNEGFDLYALRVAQAFRLPVGPATALTISGELRSASRATLGIGDTKLGARGADVSVASRFGASKVSVSIGALDNDDLSSSIVRGAFTADGFLGNARLKLSVRRAPAYETLWAPRMIGVSGSPSTTLSSQANLSLPFGSGGEVYAMGELLSVSDDNTRTAFQLAFRRRLPASLSLLYASSMMAYDHQTALYYSPARYLSHSLGLEFARYREQGLSFAVRAMPGYAWMREPAGTADSTTRDLTAFQFTTGLEFGYRRGAWDLLLSSGLSSGREGGYQSQNALLYLRRSW